jgi:hypothetical protein
MVSKQSFQSQLQEMVESLGTKFSARSVANDTETKGVEMLPQEIKILSLDGFLNLIAGALPKLEAVCAHLQSHEQWFVTMSKFIKDGRYLACDPLCYVLYSSSMSICSVNLFLLLEIIKPQQSDPFGRGSTTGQPPQHALNLQYQCPW